jgi:hypothetical protein
MKSSSKAEASAPARTNGALCVMALFEINIAVGCEQPCRGLLILVAVIYGQTSNSR